MNKRILPSQLRKYKNQWVALSPDKKRVIAADKAFRKAL